MRIDVFDKNIVYLGDCESVTSGRWKDKFYGCGDFAFSVIYSKRVKDLFELNNRVYIGKPKLGIIKSSIAKSDKSGDSLEVGGVLSEDLLNMRINWGRVNLVNQYVEVIIRKLVTDHLIAPTNTKRSIPNLSLGTIKNLPNKADYQNSFGNILTCVTALAQPEEYGFSVDFDVATKTQIFTVIKGVNRTDGQTLNQRVVFSRKNSSVISLEYTQSVTDYRNTALVGGEGEDDARTLVEVVGSYSGLDRYEMFVDARDIQSKDESGNTISSSDYNNLLLQRGNEKISEYQKVESLDGTYDAESIPEYLSLGDYVTVQDSKLGIKMDTQVTEIETTWTDKEKESHKITFGTATPTLIEMLDKVR